jgi:hypothetical protein
METCSFEVAFRFDYTVHMTNGRKDLEDRKVLRAPKGMDSGLVKHRGGLCQHCD